MSIHWDPAAHYITENGRKPKTAALTLHLAFFPDIFQCQTADVVGAYWAFSQ